MIDMAVRKRIIWGVARACGFLPALLLAVCMGLGVDSSSQLVQLCLLFHIPAIGAGYLADYFFGMRTGWIVGVVGAAMWSCGMACVIESFLEPMTFEDFAWRDFCGGFVMGAVPGVVFGWYLWVKLWQVFSFPTCLVAGALICGFGLGFYMGKCWCRYKE